MLWIKANSTLVLSDNDYPNGCETIDYSLNIDSVVYPSDYYSTILASLSSIKCKFVVNNSFYS